MTDIQIRPTIASDLPRLMGMDHSTSSEYVWQLELHRDSNQVAATFREVRLPRATQLTYPHDIYMLGDEWTRKSMMYTAAYDSDPVGYIVILERMAAHVVWITDMVVAPDMRRQGIGTTLLMASQDWASRRGAKRLIMEMQSKNYPAIRLAQKHGYEFCGYNDHYYITQDVALFFARILK